MTDTILLTGSTDVGSQGVKQLSKFNIDIRATVQTKNRADVIKNSRAHLIEMDLNRSAKKITYDNMSCLSMIN